MGDSFHWSLRGIVSERGDLSAAPRPFGEQSEAIVLPALPNQPSGLAEFAGCYLVDSTWAMPKLSGPNCGQVSLGRSPYWGAVSRGLAIFAND